MDMEHCKTQQKRTNYRTRTSPLVGAYMLMYRRIDKDPMKEVSNDLIPKELLETIKKEDEKWQQKQTEFYIRIAYEGDRTEDVVFDRNKTFGSQIGLVLKEFGLKDIAPEDIRFRAMANSRKARPYENINQSFSDIGIDDGDLIYMETKKPGEDFAEISVDWLELKVVGLDDSGSMQPKQL